MGKSKGSGGGKAASLTVRAYFYPHLFCSVGAIDNSPAIYRWEECEGYSSPGGTVDLTLNFNRPSGTQGDDQRSPSDKSLGYCHTVPTGHRQMILAGKSKPSRSRLLPLSHW